MPSNQNNHKKEFNPNDHTLGQITNLVFAGGGAKGALYPGALHALNDLGVLANIQAVSGTSAGAITASLVALGLTPDEVGEQFKKKSFADFMKKTAITDGGAYSPETLRAYVHETIQTQLFEKLDALKIKVDTGKLTLSLNDTAFINELHNDLVWSRSGISTTHRPTFADLDRLTTIFKNKDSDNPYPFKEITVTVTETKPNQAPEAVFCNASNTPNMSIADAVAYSACLPLVFSPFVTEDGTVRTDGGCEGPNTPFAPFANQERHTLGFVFEEQAKRHQANMFVTGPKLAKPTKTDKLIKAMTGVSLPKVKFRDDEIIYDNAPRVVPLNVPNGLSTVTMELTPELANQADRNAYLSVIEWASLYAPGLLQSHKPTSALGQKLKASTMLIQRIAALHDLAISNLPPMICAPLCTLLDTLKLELKDNDDVNLVNTTMQIINDILAAIQNKYKSTDDNVFQINTNKLVEKLINQLSAYLSNCDVKTDEISYYASAVLKSVLHHDALLVVQSQFEKVREYIPLALEEAAASMLEQIEIVGLELYKIGNNQHHVSLGGVLKRTHDVFSEIEILQKTENVEKEKATITSAETSQTTQTQSTDVISQPPSENSSPAPLPELNSRNTLSVTSRNAISDRVSLIYRTTRELHENAKALAEALPNEGKTKGMGKKLLLSVKRFTVAALKLFAAGAVASFSSLGKSQVTSIALPLTPHSMWHHKPAVSASETQPDNRPAAAA